MSASPDTLPAARAPSSGKHGAVGSSVARIDGPRKVRGKARFAAEVPAANLTYAAFVYSTIARGRIVAMDTAAAEQAPGVVLVMTHRNAPRLNPPGMMMSDPETATISNLPVMQDALIHWNGEPVAVILAERQEEADLAASLVVVTYEMEPASLSFAEAATHARHPENILGAPSVLTIGDPAAALAAAPYRVDRCYRTPRHCHAAIEPHAATVWWEGQNLVVHDASQMLNLTASTFARLFGMPVEQVRILSPFVGGGFGGKGLWSHQILAAAASRLAGRPVRFALSREGVARIVGGRTLTEQRVALGANADGTLAALIHTGTVAMTRYNNVPEQFTFPARHLYAAETFHLEQKVADLDMLANTFMRAPGEAVGTFALECALDELAEQMDLDPIELRRRIEPEKDPTSGTAFSSRDLLEAYRSGAERFGWAARNPRPGTRREGEWLIGMGMATATYPYLRLPGSAARITLTSDGRASVATAAQDMGMGTSTVQTQAAAERLGLPFDLVSFEYGDTALPSCVLAGGSTQTVSVLAAMTAASDTLIDQLLKLAGNDSPLAGLAPAEVVPRDGGLGHRTDAGRFESYVSILGRAGRDKVSAEAAAPLPSEMEAYSMHSFGAQFCEARVSTVTGEVRVTRFLGSFDTGRILNPKTARSQFRGGIIMGLGLALMEEVEFDERSGRVMNPSLAGYHVPVHADVPEIDVIWTDIPDPQAPLGAHGIGEIGITGVAAAVANAIYNACGRRLYDLPMTPDKLL